MKRPKIKVCSTSEKFELTLLTALSVLHQFVCLKCFANLCLKCAKNILQVWRCSCMWSWLARAQRPGQLSDFRQLAYVVVSPSHFCRLERCSCPPDEHTQLHSGHGYHYGRLWGSCRCCHLLHFIYFHSLSWYVRPGNL